MHATDLKHLFIFSEGHDTNGDHLIEGLRSKIDSKVPITGGLAGDAKPGHDRLDIRLATRRQLENLGLPRAQIAVCPLCTASEPLLFHSWRRDQVKAVQWSGIVSQA